MSDGPHRSLPMSKAWKKVAEWADNRNFESAQVVESLEHAILQDFRREIPNSGFADLKSKFGDREGDLFPDDRSQAWKDTRESLNGSPLGGLLIDCVEQAIAEGKDGLEGLECAVQIAVRERMLRGERQVEEHYHRHRDSSPSRTANVRARIEEAILQASVDGVARQLLQLDSPRSSHSGKRSGLDEGVPLR